MTEWARDSGSWPSGASARAVLMLLSPGRVAAVVVLSLTLLFVLARARAGLWPTLALTPLIVALALIVVLDVAARIIPNIITLPMLAYAFVLAATHVTIPLLQAVLGAVIGGGLPLIVAIIRRGAIGGGDVKLMAVLGAALGWKDALYVFALSHVAGALVLLTLFLIYRKFPRGRFAIGAFISLVGAIVIIAGR
jgi:leader peptidase (prepilin peptidase) / N-methyltransferase